MQELHQYIYLMQFYHLLFTIPHKLKKSFFFLKKINIFFKLYIKIGLGVFLKHI